MLRFARIALSNQSSHMHSSCTLCSSGVVIPAEKDEIMRQLECFEHESEAFDGLIFDGFEPFAHPELVTVLNQARSLGARRIGLHTDGGALSSLQNAHGCVETGVRIFEISWLGATESSHDALTKKPGLFNAMHHGIAALHQIQRERGIHLALIAKLEVCEHNKRELLAMAQDAMQQEVTALRIHDPSGVLSQDEIAQLYDSAITQGVAVFGEGVSELASAQLYTLVSVGEEASCNS